jgi:sialidase-1
MKTKISAANCTVLQLDPSTNNGRNSEGSFVTLKNGDIFFAYAKYITNSNGDGCPAVIAARLSKDGGNTWSEDDRVLIERGKAQNVMSPSLLRLKSGRIVVLYLQKDLIGVNSMSCTPFIRFSDDEMETLSDPIMITQMQEYNVINNDRIVQLSSGRLIIPIAQHRARTSWISNPGIIYYLISDDEGQTWSESKTSYYRCFPDGNGWQEPGLIELSDGRLWSWMRTGWKGGEKCGRQWESFSSDQGLTWTEPLASQFVSPYSPLSMKRIPQTGDLLAVWNDRSGRFPTPNDETPSWDGQEWEIHRTPLVCAISHDDGQSWHHHISLEDAADHGFCYTAIHFVEDAVLLAYCAGGVTTGTVLDRQRLIRIPIEQLYS